MFSDAGIISLVTFISPFQMTGKIRNFVDKVHYIEVYVKVSSKLRKNETQRVFKKKARDD